MADVAVAGAGEVVYLTPGTAVTIPAGQSVGFGDTAVLTPQAAVGDPTHTPGLPFKGRYMLVRLVESGAGTDNTVVFKAGVTGGTPANQAAYGDLTVTAAASSDQIIQLPLERFLQANGTVRAVVGGTAGSVTLSVIQLSEVA
jgi:hypothetical protein